MGSRHFELEALLSAALIALEARDVGRAQTAVRKALRWVEADWLATPSDLAAGPGPAPGAVDAADDDEDD